MDTKRQFAAVPPAALEAMIAAAQGDARKLAAVAVAAMRSGQGERAYALARDARALAPDDLDIASMTHQPLTGGVPDWHFMIVREQRRNAAYEQALRRAIRPGARVLDIGAGTGLLSMMAARAGAGQVVACEMNPAVADAAAAIVALNGLADRVRIISRHSSLIDAEADLGGPVDVLVSEIVANGLLEEEALPVMRDVIGRLTGPGTRIIPRAGQIRVALAQWAGLERHRLGAVEGFDMAPFNRLMQLPVRLDSDSARLRLGSPPATLLDVDFTSGGPYPAGRAAVDLTATAPVNGVVQWIRIQLDEETAYENAPGDETCSTWAVLFHPLTSGLAGAAGDTVRVHAAYSDSTVRLWTALANG